MKRLYLTLIVLLLLADCKKDITTATDHSATTVKSEPTKTTTTAPVNQDTLANSSFIKLALVLDSLNSDETALVFMKTANPDFNGNEDGQYLQGLGRENLASIAPDGTKMAINTMPYTPNKPIRLYAYTKNDGSYLFKMTDERTIPANLQVWVRDNLKKDSLNVRTGNYKFTVQKADTNTYGSNRFQLVLRAGH